MGGCGGGLVGGGGGVGGGVGVRALHSWEGDGLVELKGKDLLAGV